MGRKPDTKEQEEFLKYLRSGRDEMNLLEHSIFSASKEADKETRSLEFCRDDKDPETGDRVTRSWRVSFSAEYGRPTPKDDDVFVACMKLSAAQNFASPRVEFTRYELCAVLGCAPSGRNYKAIDDAFNRLRGVHIVAKNYWYDNEEKSWVSRKFGVIDDVWLYEKEGRSTTKQGPGVPRSWFRWSDVMQESFDAGYIRKLDLEVYRSLSNPIARKLYRYLGKHFWRSSRHAIELQVLCHEKLGYSQAEKRNPRLRQKITPAIKELEQKGIFGLSHEFKASYGKCEVVFVASQAKPKPQAKEEHAPLVKRLVELGVDRKDAKEACQRHSPERIVADIEHIEFQEKANRVKTSKAGMLATLLKAASPWDRPQGFVSSVERERKKRAVAEMEVADQARKAKAELARKDEEERNQAAFNCFMSKLSGEALSAFEKRGLQNFFYGPKYREAVKAGETTKAAEYFREAMYCEWMAEQKRSEAIQQGTS